VHNRDEQLFDLESDPGEWNNLSDHSAYQSVKDELRALILKQFDVEAIDREVQASLLRRQLVREAMDRTGTSWDVFPRFEGRKRMLAQYLP
jgi:hypothetical protein